MRIRKNGSAIQTPPMEQTTVMIVDTHPVLCEWLSIRLSEVPDLRVLMSTTSPELAVASVDQCRPAVVVVDGDLVGKDGPQLVQTLRESEAAPAVVMLVAEDNADAAAGALHAGAAAFVPREAPAQDLVNAIRWASKGEMWISPLLLTNLLSEGRRREEHGTESDEWASLTDREIEILMLLVEGLSHKELARRLNIALNTVRTHTRNIQIKLHVRSNLAAVSLAMAHGMRPHSLTAQESGQTPL